MRGGGSLKALEVSRGMPVGGRRGGGGRRAVIGGVPVERRLPGELLAAGGTPVADSLVLGRHMHVSPAR